MQWKITALLVAVLLTLSGCLGGDDVEGGHHDDHDDHGHDDDHGHADHHPMAPGQNDTVEPELDFAVDVRNGTAPLTVNFTWSVTGFDANATFWELDVDGNGIPDATGEGVVGNFTHTYEEVGAWNATLTVSDGGNARSETLAITVEELVVPEPEVVAFFEAEADFVTGISSGDPEWALQCPGFVAGQNGQGCVFFAFDGDLAGLPYLMEASVSSLRWAFWSGCGPTSDGINSSSAEDTVHEATVPDGAGCVIIWSAATASAAAPLTYRFTVFAS